MHLGSLILHAFSFPFSFCFWSQANTKWLSPFLKFPWGIKLTQMHWVLNLEVSKWKQKEGASSHQLTFSGLKPHPITRAEHLTFHSLMTTDRKHWAHKEPSAAALPLTFPHFSLLKMTLQVSYKQMTGKIVREKKNQGRKHRANSLHCSESNKIVMTKVKKMYLIWLVKRKIKPNYHMYLRVKIIIPLLKRWL